MIRAGDWKLVYYHGQPPQLFNLAEDPGELIDRADDTDCQAVRTELTARVLRRLESGVGQGKDGGQEGRYRHHESVG